jgi:hypothetical protein
MNLTKIQAAVLRVVHDHGPIMAVDVYRELPPGTDVPVSTAIATSLKRMKDARLVREVAGGFEVTENGCAALDMLVMLGQADARKKGAR